MRLRQILFFIAVFNSLVALAGHEISNANSNLNAIYGLDDREIITNKTSNDLREIAKSIALIIHQDELSENSFKTSFKIKTQTQSELLNVCSTERFSSLSAIAACTGFLVAEDLMVTAGHCFQSQIDCVDKKIVFDVLQSTQKNGGYKIAAKSIYSCKEIVVTQFGGEKDFAIIRLNKKVLHKNPLKMNFSNKITDNQSVMMIGHPLGQPLTISKRARVIENISSYSFKANLDSFVGNSGSPVLNSQTLEVEGILVRGEEDLLLDQENKCYLHKKYDDSSIGNQKGEGVFRMSELASYLN